MANNSLGNASLILSTAGGQLVAGLDKAKKDIDKWAKDTGQKVNKSFKESSKDKGGAGGGLLGGMLGKAAGPIAGIVAGVLTIDKAFETLAEKTKLLQVADAFAVDPQKFSGIAGLAKATGEDIREFTESLVTMGKMGSEAAAGTGQVSQQAFKDMGINAKEFINLSVDEQFHKVFESLNKMSDPLARVRNLMVMFGEDGGKYLLPLLSESPAKLREMAKGFEQSEQKMRNMAKAQKAIGAVKTAFDQIWTTLVANMAPVIELVATKLTSAFKFLAPIIDWVSRALATHWGFIADVIGEVVEAVWDVIKSIGEWISELLGLGNVAIKIEDVITKVWHGIGIGAAYLWDIIKMGAGIAAIVAGAIVKCFAAAIDVINDIVSLAKDLPDALRPDWVDGMIAGVDRVNQAVKKSGDDMMKWGKGTFDNFGKSADDVDKWFEKRKKKQEELKKAGVVKADGKGDNTFKLTYAKNDALAKGSAEAISAEVKYKTEAMFAKPANDAKQQLKELQEIKKGIFDTVAALRGNTFALVEV